MANDRHRSNDAGLSAANRGKALATVSDVGFRIGLAGLAVVTILLLTDGARPATTESARAANWPPVLTAGNGVITAILFGITLAVQQTAPVRKRARARARSPPPLPPGSEPTLPFFLSEIL